MGIIDDRCNWQGIGKIGGIASRVGGGFLSICLALTGFLAGCEHAPPPKPPAAPEVVYFVHPVVKYVTPFEEFSGRTWSPETVDIRARVSGYLEEIGFKDGANVYEGQVLFQIDDDTFQSTVDQMQAAYEQATARRTRLEGQLKRAEKLLPMRTISQEDFDVIKYDTAEAVAAEQAAAASLKMAQLNLEFTKVHAPISGRIGRTLVDAGNLVEADDTSLAMIVKLDPMYAYFEFDERTILEMRELVAAGKMSSAPDYERPVQIGLAGQDAFPLVGRINWIDNQVDPATGTLRARAEIDNPKLLLSPGMFVRLRVPVGPPEQLPLIPEEALGSDQGQRYVYVIDKEDKIEYRQVEIGWLEGTLRVIKSGVEPDDRIVVTGLQRIRPNDVVTPKPQSEAEELLNAKSAPEAESDSGDEKKPAAAAH